MSSQYQVQHSGWLIFLSVLTMTLLLAGTVVSNKLVNLEFLLQPASSFIYPISFLLFGIIAEVYGYEISKKLIWIIVICGYVFALSVETVLLLPSAEDWQNGEAFQTVFGYLLRFTTAGTIGILTGLFINCYFIAKTKILIMGRYFWLRSVGAVVLGEAAHILINTFFTFLGRMPLENIFLLMANIYLFRVVCVMIFVIPAQIIVTLLKNKENIDSYDYDIHFNPFRFQ